MKPERFHWLNIAPKQKMANQAICLFIKFCYHLGSYKQVIFLITYLISFLLRACFIINICSCVYRYPLYYFLCFLVEFVEKNPSTLYRHCKSTQNREWILILCGCYGGMIIHQKLPSVTPPHPTRFNALNVL